MEGVWLLEPITCCMFYQDTAKFQKVVQSCLMKSDELLKRNHSPKMLLDSYEFQKVVEICTVLYDSCQMIQKVGVA